MSTTIRITLPIAPGAKTCEGCPCHDALANRCDVFLAPDGNRQTVLGARLPECLASERVKVGERWILRYRRPQWVPTDAWSSREFDTREALDDERSMIERVNPETQFRIVHITRYRRRA